MLTSDFVIGNIQEILQGCEGIDSISYYQMNQKRKKKNLHFNCNTLKLSQNENMYIQKKQSISNISDIHKDDKPWKV